MKKDDPVQAIEHAFRSFRRLLWPLLLKGETMNNGQPAPDRRKNQSGDRRRKRPDEPQRVYLLVRNGQTLDVYQTVKSAFVAAQTIVGQTEGRWRQGRPGSWWGEGGNLEINEFEVKI